MCELLHADELLVEERDGVVALVAYAGRAPYELLVAPIGHRHNAFQESELLTRALSLAAATLRRLMRIEGPVPCNLWLHAGAHWHIEVLPRLTVFAGIELGAGIYVNPVPPEQAAEALRQARP